MCGTFLLRALAPVALILALAACSEPVPERQAEFSALHKAWLTGYRNGTSAQKDLIPAERKKQLAAFMAKGDKFTDWQVEVKDVRREGGSGLGRLVSDTPVAVLSVTFDGITLENSYTRVIMDLPDDVMPQGSQLYEIATALQKGQKVKVSGSFVPDSDGLPRELSLTDSGAVESPEYVVVFTAIKVDK